MIGTRLSQLAGSGYAIPAQKLERSEHDDPHAVMRQVPGVFVREEDGLGLRPNIAMRGVNPDRSKKATLMEDGILFGPAPYSAPAAYYFPLITRIEQVRVIKGPGAVSFGPQTVGGAIDLVTRSIPASPVARVDLAAGQYWYRKAHAYAGFSDQQYGFLIEGVHLANDGFKSLPDGASTGAARNEWMVKGSYVVDPRAGVEHKLSIKLGYSSEASNETYLGLTDEDFDLDADRRYPASALDRMDYHRTSAALTHEVSSYDGDYGLQTTVYRNDFFRVWRKLNRLGGATIGPVLAYPEDPSNAALYGVLSGQIDGSGDLDAVWIGPNRRAFVSQGVYSRFRWSTRTGSFTHKLEAGLRLHHDSIDRDHAEEAFRMVDGQLLAAQAPSLTTTRNFASTHALALHVTDAVSYGRLTVTPGVRVEGILSRLDDYLADTSSTRRLAAVLPGLGAHFALTSDWGVLAGVYRGFSPPAPGSADTIDPEYSINYEAGTRYWHRRTKLALIGFFNEYSNLTDICTSSSGCLDEDVDRQFDAGSARIYGLEASASHEFEVGALRFPVSCAYTLNFSEFNTTFESDDPIYGSVARGDELPYVPRHQLNAQIAAEHDRFGLYVSGDYVAAVREQAGDAPLAEVLSTDPLITFHAGASLKLLRFLKAYANVRNLLNYRGIMAHRPFGARPNAPLWIQVGLKGKL